MRSAQLLIVGFLSSGLALAATACRDSDKAPTSRVKAPPTPTTAAGQTDLMWFRVEGMRRINGAL